MLESNTAVVSFEQINLQSVPMHIAARYVVVQLLSRIFALWRKEHRLATVVTHYETVLEAEGLATEKARILRFST